MNCNSPIVNLPDGTSGVNFKGVTLIMDFFKKFKLGSTFQDIFGESNIDFLKGGERGF